MDAQLVQALCFGIGAAGGGVAVFGAMSAQLFHGLRDRAALRSDVDRCRSRAGVNAAAAISANRKLADIESLNRKLSRELSDALAELHLVRPTLTTLQERERTRRQQNSARVSKGNATRAANRQASLKAVA